MKLTPVQERAEERIKELRSLVDPSLSRYDDIRKLAEEILAELGEGPEAEEARELLEVVLEEVETRYVEQGEQALKAAIEAAEGLAGRGDFDAAARSFILVRMRFGESEWLRSKAEPRIADVLEKIEKVRGEYERSGLAFEDDFSGHEDGSRVTSSSSTGWSLGRGRVRDERLVFDDPGRAQANVRGGRHLTVRATVLVTEKAGGNWSWCGVSAWQHGGQYWEVGLSEGPGGRHYLLFFELFRGVWHRIPAACGWKYGSPYVVTLKLDPDGVTGSVSEPVGHEKGATLATVGKRFDEKRRASASCRPGVVASGCRGVFDDFSATVRDTPRREPQGRSARRTTGVSTVPLAIGPGQPDKAPDKKVREGGTKGEPPPPELPRGPKGPLPGETGLPGQWAPGLIAEIFNGHDFRDRVGVRIDRQIGFDFYGSPPDLGAKPDDFAIRWTGWLLVPHDGEYVLEAKADDRLSVELSGRSIIAGKGRSQALALRKGLHPVSAEYFEDRGGASCSLQWKPLGGKPPGGKMGTIPADYFFHEVPELGLLGPFASLLEGMWAEYYKGEDFGRKIAEGPVVHPAVDYGDMPPCPGCPEDGFSVRMTGYFLAPWNGDYRFDVDVDDGVRLKMDGETVVDHWGVGHSGLVSGKVTLTAGYHEAVIEHMERSGNAKIHFWWVPPAYGDINKTTFYYMPERPWFYKAVKQDIVDREGLAPGVRGRLYGREAPKGKALFESLDPAMWFSWGGGRPAPGVPHDRFSGRWEGTLVVPRTGLYTFRVRHRGGVGLAIGRRPVVTKWEDADGWQKGSIPLRAGKLPISLMYCNIQGIAEVKVYWSGPGFGLRKLGSDALGHRADRLQIAAARSGRRRGPDDAARASREGAARREPQGRSARRTTVTGNQVRNGGFEEKDNQTKFATFWRPHQWGEPDVRPGRVDDVARTTRHSIRIDRAQPRTGQAALAVKAFGEGGGLQGVRTGAYAALALPAGRYEFSFWARADVDEKARVGAHLAGQDLAEKTVGDDWQQFREMVEIRQRQAGAALRLWTVTKNVRVWFDDVEVVPVR